MNQASLHQIVSKLPIAVSARPRRLRNPEGSYGRLRNLCKTVTALVRHERIELNYTKADEARGYMERLLSDAIRYGDCHRPTMAQATFWLEDPALVPKLFKVLAPRYQNYSPGIPFTRLLRAPSTSTDVKERLHGTETYDRAVLELRGNPYPPLPGPTSKKNPGHIHNVLLEEARKDYFKSQSAFSQQAEREVQALPDEDSKRLEDVAEEDIDEEANKEILLHAPNEDPSSQKK